MKLESIEPGQEQQPNVEVEFPNKRPKLASCDDLGDNQRHMRSASIVYLVPNNYLWNQFVDCKIESPRKLMPVIDQKFGKYSPQEDKVIRNAINSPSMSIRSIALLLNRSFGSVKARMTKLKQDTRTEHAEEESSSDSSMAVLNKFLAVEEESSVDIDAAAYALEYMQNKDASESNAYLQSDLPEAVPVPDQPVSEATACLSTCDACEDLRSLLTLSDLSSTAMNLLSAAAAEVCQEKEKELVVVCDDGTLSDSGASTFPQIE